MDRKYALSVAAGLLVCAAVATCGCSEKDLSQGKAEKLLTDAEKESRQVTSLTLGNSLKKDAASPRVVMRYYNYRRDYEKQHKGNELGGSFTTSTAKWQDLEKKGLIKYKMTETRVPNEGGDFLGDDRRRYRGKEECPNPSNCSFYDAFQIKFTPAAEKYLSVERKPAISTGANEIVRTMVMVTTASFDKVTVTRMNPAPGKAGDKTMYVDYVVHYRPTPFGDIYLTKEDVQKEKSAIFQLFDDGWRRVM